MFIGTYEHALDDKGRVSLPVRFRELLTAQGECRLVVTTNVDPAGRCLVAYPIKEWAAFHERIAGLPQFDENVIRLKRLHIASAAECATDRNGRILLPTFLRDYAGLKDGIVFAGLGTHVEIWDKVQWEQERETAKQSLPEINETLARLGL